MFDGMTFGPFSRSIGLVASFIMDAGNESRIHIIKGLFSRNICRTWPTEFVKPTPIITNSCTGLLYKQPVKSLLYRDIQTSCFKQHYQWEVFISYSKNWLLINKIPRLLTFFLNLWEIFQYEQTRNFFEVIIQIWKVNSKCQWISSDTHLSFAL